MANNQASFNQERSFSLRLRMRSTTLLQHKGKIGLCILIIFLFSLILSVAIPFWNKIQCHSLSPSYKFCNSTLRKLENKVCYRYNNKEKKNLNRIYRQCALNSNVRCKRQMKIISLTNVTTAFKTFVLPSVHDHVFYKTVDDITAETIAVYLVINGTCVLNYIETDALLHLF